MDIEIKNEAQAINICGNAKSDKIKQLNSHINTLNTLINKIKVNWESTGSDQATYIAELEKQAANLKTISDQSYRFFDVIERYVDTTQKTSSKTVGSGGGSGGSSSVGGGVASGVSAAAAAAAGAIKKTAGSVAGVANSVGSKVSSTSGGGTVTNDPGVPNTGIVGTASGSLKPTLDPGVSSGGGTTGGSSGGTSGGSSTVSSIHGTGNGASTINGLSGKTNGGSGSVGSTGTGTTSGGAGGTASSAGRMNGVSGTGTGVNGSSGSVTTAASEIFTSDKLDGVVPKLSVPMSSGGSTASKAVPIVSGGIAAGAVGLGAAAIMKKTPAAKPEKNLEIDAWEETKDVQPESEISTMEQKLGELTFEDIIM